VVAEAGDGYEALALIKQCPPDVVLLDVAMPNLNGLEAMERLQQDTSPVKVIILSIYANEEYVIRALHAGAAGYLLKDCVPREFEEAIRMVMKGQTYLSARVSQGLIDYIRHHGFEKKEQKSLRPSLEQLTRRQREVLQLIAEGHSTREIASHLHLSVKTVETHRAQLMERLNLHDVASLVKYALRTGVISAEP
jgi:DNA-binding NarL/FixJ family response regulator